MQKIIAGNWKMHGSRPMALALAQAVAGVRTQAVVVLCPPATLLEQAAAGVAGSAVRLGGQDCHAEREGAFTGDISAGMLKEAGCDYVIVGHSERRQYHAETDETVAAKARAALAAGLTPIVCVGESLAQREAGQALAVVERQLKPLPEGKIVLAYEPVWAIGTGRTPTVQEIAEVHARLFALRPDAPALYGGSVKAGNAEEIMAIAHVAGVLVGGASLKAQEFCAIIEAVS